MTHTDATLFDAEAAKQDAIERAERGAGESWCALADATLRIFIRTRDTPFTCADFRAFAERTLDAPPEPRAYGAVIQRASKKGMIRPVGHAPSGERVNHNRLMTLWERA